VVVEHQAERGALGEMVEDSVTAISEFGAFWLQGAAVDLGVGVMLGSTFSDIVSSISNDIILPFASYFIGTPLLDNFVLLRQGRTPDKIYRTYPEALADGAVTLNYGRLVEKLSTSLLLGIVLYWLVQSFTLFRTRLKKRLALFQQRPRHATSCVECMEPVHPQARRCPHCTASLIDRNVASGTK